MKVQSVMIAVAFIVGVVSNSAQITNANNTKYSGSKPAVSLALSANPQQMNSGESTWLTVSLKNVSAEEIFVGREVSESDDSDYDVFVVDDKGVESPATPYYRFLKGKRLSGDPRFRGPLSRDTSILKPGEILKSQINLVRLRTLNHAGTYKIWVERFDGVSKLRVKSNVITVTVTP